MHIRTSELVRDASAGAVIIIERRGEPIAELRPLSRKSRRVKLPDMTKFWASMPKIAGDSGKYLEEDR